MGVKFFQEFASRRFQDRLNVKEATKAGNLIFIRATDSQLIDPDAAERRK